ncbi:ATP-binding protein [Actinoplanes sp. NPDC048791]|uniref:ATP-binding protein n=1 Tax=Actinoplanes sp. NPDC048791 TaxID=3154623 RepID=UPI00340CCCB2
MTAVDRRAQARPLESPYLINVVTDRHGVGAAVTTDAGLEVIEVAVHGRWSPQVSDRVAAALPLCLAGPSPSIIVDLRDLEDTYGASLPFWLALWREARLADTPMHMAFCLPEATALSRRLRNLEGPQPRVFATVREARIGIAARVSRADRRQVRLEPHPASVAAARTLVTQACRLQNLPGVLQDACLIVSELAANAVEHAGTDLVVTVSHSGTRLHVAVHDRVSMFPRPGELELVGPRGELEERGRGLPLVHRVATAWGVVPTRHGKVVWATVM